MSAAPPALAFLASCPDGSTAICAIAKRTYAFDALGRAERVDGPDLKSQEESGADGPFPLLEHDLDLWPMKVATDVVLTGSAYPPLRGGATRMLGITVGGFRRSVALFGDRRVARTSRGVRFSEPRPFERIELSLRRAYGGVDCSVPVAEAESEVEALLRTFLQEHPGMYPRNPGGVGYAVNAAWVDGLVLPNFEDPRRLLTPENLVVGRAADWWRMPLPQGFGWFPPHCFPRCVHFGNVPERDAPEDPDLVEELRMGLLSRGQSARARETLTMDSRGANGACPGMQLPTLNGDELVELDGFSPEGVLRFKLPAADRPEVRVRHRGRDLVVTRKVHTLVVAPDERRFSIVWGVTTPAPNEVPERVPKIVSNETTWDPLEGVDVTIDGLPCACAEVTLPRLPRAPWEMG